MDFFETYMVHDHNIKYSSTQVSKDLTLTVPETKTAEFANSIDVDEVAHHEPPHLDLHCLPK